MVVAGAAECGKTSLVAGIYGLFHQGPFGGFLFAGSQTLPGFERRCHLARLSSGNITPDTERTKFTDDQHLLHIRLSNGQPGDYYDLLLSDIRGEAFRRASDSADDCRKMTILKRADFITVLIDGGRTVDKKERQAAFSSADALIGQCVDTGMLGKTSIVQAVLTKWDLVAAASAAQVCFVDEKLHWLVNRYAGRIGTITSHKVAIRRSNSHGIKTGHGIADLLKAWALFRDHRIDGITEVSSKQFHSEFDRMASTLRAKGER